MYDFNGAQGSAQEEPIFARPENPNDATLRALADAITNGELNDATRTDLWTAAGFITDPSTFHTYIKKAEEARDAAKSTEEGPTPDLVFRTLADIARDVDTRPPREFLFEPVIVAGDYGIMAAEKKAGKSWGVGDAAVSCAAGMPWMGAFPCRTPGCVLVFYGEGSDAKLTRRLRAIGAAKGLSYEQTDALDIVVCCRAPQLNDEQHLHLMRKAVEQYRPKLVIIDPLYLSAGGAKGSDLYSMGALLGNVQRVVQDAGASLMISHHWNKGGQGNGHDRSSGVGPAEWGRFLISVAVKSKSTNPVTLESTVVLDWQFAGDEIADTGVNLIRRVRAEDPTDLNSPMHYSVTIDTMPDQGGQEVKLKPAEWKLLQALQQAKGYETIERLVDRVKKEHGHGLVRETCARGLKTLTELGYAAHQEGLRTGFPGSWVVTEKGAARPV
ncbi:MULTISPECIES: AAA family ATPase [Streptomyces]|uniref:AAA family ATPase n=1 Tax=Streptomyces dengpaensis TaxID=2049881 RepID=A0ABN5I6P6_9ACTN|nr:MULTISPECIES: AAA family ATPase [Streptomyces]AVH58674.1 hypothetical protein C4B68_26160 [Streptomyces dengpaensis]PIB11267.1 hypothetical protein B1C81_05480 [Streptomyces sp. HG99]